LNFTNLIKKEFNFLEENYDFTYEIIDDSHVRYENNEIFIRVMYDARRSFELALDLGQKNDKSNAHYDLGHILGLKDINEQAYFMASSQKSLEICISRLSKLTSKYTIEFLENHEMYFQRLLKFKEKRQESYWLNKNLRLNREKLKNSWEKRDYLKFCELFPLIEKYATNAEKKKFSFSSQKLKQALIISK